MKITIKVKIFGFIILNILILSFIGYTGIVGVHKLADSEIFLYQKMLVPTGQLGEITEAYQRLRVNTRDIILANSEDSIKKYNERIKEIKELLEKWSNEYEKSIITNEMRLTFEDYKRKLKYYNESVATKIIDLALQNKDSEAIALLQSDDVFKAAADLQDTITKMIEMKKNQSQKESNNNDLTNNITNNVLLIILGSVFLSLIIGFMITSNLYRIINSLMLEAKKLTVAVQEGQLNLRGNVEETNFEFREIVRGVNEIIEAFVKPINVTAHYIDSISKGNMPPKITDEYKGDFNKIKNNLNQCINAVELLIKDANLLAVAAVEGKLSTRADASVHSGDFRSIVEGVNNTLDSVINPLNVAAKYVDDISKGNIPSKITDEYKGDFNKIKNNLNKCIDAVNELVKDANLLSTAAIEGRLETRANAEKHKGDFKKIVEGVNNTLDAVLLPVTEARGCLEEMANSNFNTEMQGNYKGDHATLKNSLNSTITSINEVLNQVKTTVDQVNSGSSQVAAASQSLSQSSTESASSLEEISASMQQMSTQIKQNTENAVTANQVSNQAKSTAENGNNKMKDMVRAMNEINESAKNISKIIKAIDEIAFQTNLLALNAAVEAARAGKHGKGFTVVAEEVRNLAQRSAKAAKETAEMIEGAIAKTEIGNKIAGDTAKVLEEIAVGAVKATDLMGEIAAASKEQSEGIIQINQGLSQLDKVTQQNTATAEEAASASEELSSQSAYLKDMVEKFRLKDENKTVNAYVSHNSKVIKQTQKKLSEHKPMLTNNNNLIAENKQTKNNASTINLDDNNFGNF